MNKYKYIFFDWDGCLADTLALWFEIYQQISRENGVVFTNEHFRIVSGNWKKSQEITHENDLKVFKQKMETGLINYSRNLKLSPNVIAVLDYIRNKSIPMAIVTGSRKNILKTQLEVTKISEYFEVLVTSDDTEKHKPDPEPLLKAISLLNASPDNVLMVGDTESDIQAANSAGIDSVWYKNKDNIKFYGDPVLKVASPTYTIDDLSELIPIICSKHQVDQKKPTSKQS